MGSPMWRFGGLSGGLVLWYLGAWTLRLVLANPSRNLPTEILKARLPQDYTTEEEQLWLYEGALYDPLDGRKVANVQGLEMVRPLVDTRGLAIDGILKAPKAAYEDHKTLWTQKVFCYTSSSSSSENNDAVQNERTLIAQPSENGRETILNHVRIRPQSPKTKVPLNQAVAVYETATTFVATTPSDLLVHSEWPNGQTMWGHAQNCKQHSNGMDFTIFAKLRNKYSPLYAPDLVPKERTVHTGKKKWFGRKASEDDDSETGVIVSPKRAALVQFGSADKTMETKHKYGARETYSYKCIPQKKPRAFWKKALPPLTSVHYTRYGEAPPFYAPGRMCMLELRGKPIDSLDQATLLLRELLESKMVQNFHVSGPAVWDRSKGLKLLEATEEESADGVAWTRNGRRRARALWDRIRASTMLQDARS